MLNLLVSGLLATVATIVISIALLFSVIGIPVSFAIVGLLVLLLSISTAITCIAITYKLKEKFTYSKNYLTYLTLVGVAIVIWALKLIPYVGLIISILVKMIGLGIIVYYLFEKSKTKKDKIDKTTKKEKKEKEPKKEDKKKE